MLDQLKHFTRLFTATAYYLLVAFPLVVSAAQVTLNWDANNPAPDGYNLYQRAEGQSYDYSAPVNDTGVTSTNYTINGLTEGVTYYFVVRAYVGTEESGDSNEASFTAPVAVTDSDSDNDGYNDSVDAFPNDSTEWLDTDGDNIGNNADGDDDGDGMLDTWEILYGLDPLDNTDANGDLDGDGMSNLNEHNNGSDPSQVPGNIIPDQPVLAAPADGAFDVDLMPTLMTQAFSDSDGDAHNRTIYQVATSTDWSVDIVFEGEYTQFLTDFTLGDLILEPETTYYWRVRFYDEHNGESDWSMPFSFTTIDNATAGYVDDDDDGIINEQEVADADIDPELEVSDDMVVVGSDDTINSQLAVLLSGNADIVSLRTVDADIVETGRGDNRPEIITGLISFKVGLHSGDTTADVTVHFTAPAPDDAAWFKYDPENGWVEYSNVTFAGDRKSITIHLTDGGAGDDDGVQNGVIVDPSGLGYSSGSGYSISDSSSAAGGSGGGCFIGASMAETKAHNNNSQSRIQLLLLVSLIGIAVTIRNSLACKK